MGGGNLKGLVVELVFSCKAVSVVQLRTKKGLESASVMQQDGALDCLSLQLCIVALSRDHHHSQRFNPSTFLGQLHRRRRKAF